jgi:predicted glycogen debranching enzyme
VPPTERFVLVNGIDAWIDTPEGRVALTSQTYQPDFDACDAAQRIESFDSEPWPHWRIASTGGGAIEHELFAVHGAPLVALHFAARGSAVPATGLRLCVRPFLSGRDYHALHRENSALRFEPEQPRAGELRFQTYPDVPPIRVLSNGAYRHDPHWYKNFRYDAERARGFEHSEDCASPGVIEFDLGAGDAYLLFASDGAEARMSNPERGAESLYRELADAERARRADFASPLLRAADAYLVRRGRGQTILAGYPWFTDWGRDTFIALRGLCLATGRPDVAREILLEWTGAVSRGMLPNRFTDAGEAPDYNAVDASLWFVVAVHELLEALAREGTTIRDSERERLIAACHAILEGYARSTRYGIRADADGLLAAGAPGVQLTWMDAKIGDSVVTPRIGKPVEIQALWFNALALASAWNTRWKRLAERAAASFEQRFWNEASGCLFDVVDVDHEPGRDDASFRPNQLFAIGGLPRMLLSGERARRVVNAVEAKLWTPLGPRSLARGEPGYAPRYEGGPVERDHAYHQGTVWPWLAGPFVEAWVRVRGNTPAVRAEARVKFLLPLAAVLERAGVGHLCEIADAEAPQRPAGCYFQAWSLGEYLRLERGVLAP